MKARRPIRNVLPHKNGMIGISTLNCSSFPSQDLALKNRESRFCRKKKEQKQRHTMQSEGREPALTGLSVERVRVDPGIPTLTPEPKDNRGRRYGRVPGQTKPLGTEEEFLPVPELAGNRAVICTDRNNMKKLFGQQLHEKFCIQVNVRPEQPKVYFFHIMHQKEDGDFVLGQQEGDVNKEFASGFEMLMTNNTADLSDSLHCFTKMEHDSLVVVMRCQVDCCDKNGALVELKNVDANKEMHHWLWPYLQMRLGSVEKLVVGYWQKETEERLLVRVEELDRAQLWEKHQEGMRKKQQQKGRRIDSNRAKQQLLTDVEKKIALGWQVLASMADLAEKDGWNMGGTRWLFGETEYALKQVSLREAPNQNEAKILWKEPKRQ